MTAALPAFLVEAVFYLAMGFEQTRAWFDRAMSARGKAGILWVSALLPYLIFSLTAGTFERHAFYLLAALTAVLAFWHVVLPQRVSYDVGFLVVAAAPVLLGVFPRIYLSPDAHLRVDILGHLMWIRVGIMALLLLRGWDPGPFSFWPHAREWKAGFTYFALAVLPIIGLALGVRDVRFEPLHGAWWQVAGMGLGTFFGMLWVVALSEEFFFRGVIERAILNQWGSAGAAIGLSAVLFGSVHLAWNHEFPNWRHAAVVTLLGVVLGTAYPKTGGVRAPMVTHALVVTTWRLFFKSI